MKLSFFNIDRIYQNQISEVICKFIEDHKLNPNLQISVFFVPKVEIRALNKKYRNIDKSTDVLSFPIWKSLKDIPKRGPIILGDIFICPDKTNIDKNLSGLIQHSLNHLIGKHE